MVESNDPCTGVTQSIDKTLEFCSKPILSLLSLSQESKDTFLQLGEDNKPNSCFMFNHDSDIAASLHQGD